MRPHKIPVDIADIFLACTLEGVVFWRAGDVWCFAANPKRRITGSEWEVQEAIDELTSLQKKPISDLPLALPFGFGFFSYDFGRESLGVRGRKDYKTPLLQWNLYDSLAWGELGSGVSYCIGDAEIFTVSNHTQKERYSLSSFSSLHDKSLWQEGFTQVQKDIHAGEIYQLNLGRQFSADFSGNPRQVFLDLFASNPAKYAVFLQGDSFEILSMSPELFLCFQDNSVTTEPIKGTRKRGKDTEEDEANKIALLASEKESAELLMITDLLRNDLSQTCLAGTIIVEEVRALQQNPTVWHTYSRIRGERKPQSSIADTLFSCLPGGSVSGCPKKRACEIIEHVEPHARGIFCGSIGYLDAAGNGEFSILIRTLLRHQEQLYFQAAGGITAYSEAEREAEELNEKCAAFFRLREMIF